MTSCRLAGGYRSFGVTAFTFRVVESGGANHLSDWRSLDTGAIVTTFQSPAVTVRHLLVIITKSPRFPTVSLRVQCESDNKRLP